MSLVLPSREVAAGPTVGLKSQGAPTPVTEAASPPVGFVGVPEYLRVAGDKWKVPPAGKEAVGKGAVVVGFRNGFGGLGGRKTSTGCMAAAAAEEEEEEGEKDADSSESSSIGEGGESSLSLSSSTAEDRGDGEEEVQSKLRKDALVSLNSLEESLPIKRGLSNCFSGKSKSFANLSDAAALGTSARDLAKAENPFNKRRRILMASKASWQRRASYAALNTSNLWALEEGEEYHDVDDGKHGGRGDDGGVDGVPNLPPPSPSRGRKHVKAFRTPRSFSLTDLQHA